MAQWIELNSTGNPQTSGYGSVSCAIDSGDIIHIAYMYYNGKASQFRYVTFNTSTGLFSGDTAVNSDIGADPTALSNLYTAIAIDANDIPHVAYSEYPSKGGLPSLYYNNRIGGAWNASGVEVEGGTSGDVCIVPDITIDLDNKPYIAYFNNTADDVTVVIGNGNDATSFTLHDLETSISAGTRAISVCVDSSGNHYLAGVQNNGWLTIYKHLYSDGWTTWQSSITNSDDYIGSSNLVSMIIVGSDIYVFYEDSSGNDIVYDKYSGTWGSGTWLGETALETGTFNSVKAKWGFWADRNSDGVINIRKESVTYSTSTTVGGYYGNSTVYFGTNLTGDILWYNVTTLVYYQKGTVTGTLDAQIYDIDVDGKPTGSALATSTNSVTSFPVGDGNKTFSPTFSSFPSPGTYGLAIVLRMQYTGTYDSSNYLGRSFFMNNLNQIPDGQPVVSGDGGATWTIWTSGYDYSMTLSYRIRNTEYSATEIDYVFVDETADPDIWFNTLALTTPDTTWKPRMIVF